MEVFSQPVCLTMEEFRQRPLLEGQKATEELAKAGSELLDGGRIDAIGRAVTKSHERVCDLSEYVKKYPNFVPPEVTDCLQWYGASAFDDGTVQDLKHHRK